MKKKPTLQEFLESAGLSLEGAVPLTPSEERRVVESLVQTHGDDLTKEIVERVIEWAAKMRITHGLFENVLNGSMDLMWKDGDVAFSVSAKGTAVVADMIKRHSESKP